MYRFTNGIVVFDEKTKDEYIKAGMQLVEIKKVVEENKDGDIDNDTIDEEHSRNDKKTSKNRK